MTHVALIGSEPANGNRTALAGALVVRDRHAQARIPCIAQGNPGAGPLWLAVDAHLQG